MTKELIWRAVYHDGYGNLTESCLNQYNEDGTENRYKDIDRLLLGRFDLLEKETGKLVFSLFIRDGQRLIFRRRTLIHLMRKPNPDGSVPEHRNIVFLVGWQQTIVTQSGKLKNITALNYIYEDGYIELDNSRDNLEFLPEEEY